MRVDMVLLRAQYGSGARCWVNGREVTNRCFEADDEEGVVYCYVLSKRGMRTGGTEALRGSVMIALPRMVPA